MPITQAGEAREPCAFRFCPKPSGSLWTPRQRKVKDSFICFAKWPEPRDADASLSQWGHQSSHSVGVEADCIGGNGYFCIKDFAFIALRGGPCAIWCRSNIFGEIMPSTYPGSLVKGLHTGQMGSRRLACLFSLQYLTPSVLGVI